MPSSQETHSSSPPHPPLVFSLLFFGGWRQFCSFFSLRGQLRKLHQYVNDLIFKHLKKPLINIDLNTCHQWLALIQCKQLIHKLQWRAICGGLPIENGRERHWSCFLSFQGWNKADSRRQKMSHPFLILLLLRSKCFSKGKPPKTEIILFKNSWTLPKFRLGSIKFKE